MPIIRVDWSKQDTNKPMEVPGLFDHLPRTESAVVLCAARWSRPSLVGASPNTFVECAIALGEVTHIDAVMVTINTLPPGQEDTESQGVARARIPSTRLNFRSGDPAIVLHPFDVIEPIFRAYRQQRDFPRPLGPQVEPRFVIYAAPTTPRMYVLAEVHDEIELTTDRDKAMRFSERDARLIMAAQKALGGDYRLEPA